jgi:NitT/TauT family transport system permease protein
LVVALFIAALIMVWQAAAMSGRWSPVLLPPPRAVALYLWDSLRDGTLVEAAGVTLRRLLLGYAIGIAIGLPLGLATSTSEYMQDTVVRLLLACKSCRACAGCR